MQIVKFAAFAALVVPLSACLENDTERALAGAAAGAVIADYTKNDVATGAIVGAGIGAFCDDLNVPGCVNRPRY
jgi:osmotically inducible lipoprotein OsmB